jgi:DNA methyltransferase 1-associated protein 1
LLPTVITHQYDFQFVKYFHHQTATLGYIIVVIEILVMGDVAQILGGAASAASSAVAGPHKALRISGMPKSIMNLIAGKQQDPASASLPPIVPTFTGITKKSSNIEKTAKEEGKTNIDKNNDEIKVKVGNKWITSSKPARPWTWAPFASSSRTDGAMFHHWVRANVEYTDYPYAKFDIHLDPVTYTEEEYHQYLQSETWTQSETNKLMDLARILELRWPVIYDRWIGYFEMNEDNNKDTKSGHLSRKIEDLQHRYYFVAATLSQIRIAQAAAQEAQSLSVAAAAAAAAATQAAAAAVATPSSSLDGNPTTTTSTPTAIVQLQEKAEAMLLESAAARSLATSGKQSQPLITHIGTGTSNKLFDLAHERERRYHLDRLWKRSKKEELEELELRKELRIIEAQLRKLKKSGGHLLAAAASAAASSGLSSSSSLGGETLIGIGGTTSTTTPAPSRLASAASSRNPSRAVSPVGIVSSMAENQNNSQFLDQSFASTAPVPMPHHPYLQSGRLVPPATGRNNGINKSLLARMDLVLEELHIPPRPIPTKRVCDLYDMVRKDILTLVTLQKLTMQKEGILQMKRVKLAKLGGASLPPDDAAALDEEKLLGINPPPSLKPAAAAPAPVPPTTATTKSKPTKKRGGTTSGGGGGKAKSAKKSADGIEKSVVKGGTTATATASSMEGGATKLSSTTATTTGKKKTIKRKRKTEPGKNPNPAPIKKAGSSKAGGGGAAGSALSATKAGAPGSLPLAVLQEATKTTTTTTTPPPAAASTTTTTTTTTTNAGATPSTVGSAKKRVRTS